MDGNATDGSFNPQCMNSSLSHQEGGGDSSDQQISSENMVGVAIAVIANSIIPISLNLQKYAHTRNTGADGNPIRPLTRIPLWWVGIWLMGGARRGSNAWTCAHPVHAPTPCMRVLTTHMHAHGRARPATGGEAFNLLAYGYSPTSLVAPVGAIGKFVSKYVRTYVRTYVSTQVSQ